VGGLKLITRGISVPRVNVVRHAPQEPLLDLRGGVLHLPVLVAGLAGEDQVADVVGPAVPPAHDVIKGNPMVGNRIAAVVALALLLRVEALLLRRRLHRAKVAQRSHAIATTPMMMKMSGMATPVPLLTHFPVRPAC
jgi:hypothetical protein